MNSLTTDFYEKAFPELTTPADHQLVMAKIREIRSSGRQCTDNGALLYEVG